MRAIEAERVTKSFGMPPTLVLRGIDLSLERGGFAAITGRSGSGKSTLLYILSSLDPATSGDVRILGRRVSEMTEGELHRFRNTNLGFVFQFHHLLPELTALENTLMPALKTGRSRERRAYAESLLDDFGLGDKLHRFPRQLSGGEQQRVAIARALVMEPEFVFADEPTGNLDSANGEAVMRILQRISGEKGTTVVYVTHDADFAALAAQRIHLVDGAIDGHPA